MMSNDQMETIETSRMQVMSEFAAAGWVHQNRERFRVGLSDANVIIASLGPDGRWSGSMFFERANLAAVTSLLGQVLNGRLYDENKDYLGIVAGRDEVGISTQAPRGTLTISLYNNRPARMDAAQTSAWNLTVAPDTALKLYVELKQLVEQGIA
jgi:hypothetical protein